MITRAYKIFKYSKLLVLYKVFMTLTIFWFTTFTQISVQVDKMRIKTAFRNQVKVAQDKIFSCLTSALQYDSVILRKFNVTRRNPVTREYCVKNNLIVNLFSFTKFASF